MTQKLARTRRKRRVDPNGPPRIRSTVVRILEPSLCAERLPTNPWCELLANGGMTYTPSQTDGKAVDCGTHWFGGPDFLVEVRSPKDDTYEKIPFYARVQVREFLIVERDERDLRLYRHDGADLALVGSSTSKATEWLASEVVPLAFRWKDVRGKPQTEVKRTDGKWKTWMI